MSRLQKINEHLRSMHEHIDMTEIEFEKRGGKAFTVTNIADEIVDIAVAKNADDAKDWIQSCRGRPFPETWKIEEIVV